MATKKLSKKRGRPAKKAYDYDNAVKRGRPAKKTRNNIVNNKKRIKKSDFEDKLKLIAERSNIVNSIKKTKYKNKYIYEINLNEPYKYLLLQLQNNNVLKYSIEGNKINYNEYKSILNNISTIFKLLYKLQYKNKEYKDNLNKDVISNLDKYYDVFELTTQEKKILENEISKLNNYNNYYFVNVNYKGNKIFLKLNNIGNKLFKGINYNNIHYNNGYLIYTMESNDDILFSNKLINTLNNYILKLKIENTIKKVKYDNEKDEKSNVKNKRRGRPKKENENNKEKDKVSSGRRRGRPKKNQETKNTQEKVEEDNKNIESVENETYDVGYENYDDINYKNDTEEYNIEF